MEIELAINAMAHDLIAKAWDGVFKSLGKEWPSL
jgi:hypothetical protein